jgi:hypothetical protein
MCDIVKRKVLGILSKKYVLTFTISLLLAIISCWKLIVSPGYVYLAEHFEVYTIQDFLKVFTSTWRSYLHLNCLKILLKDL